MKKLNIIIIVCLVLFRFVAFASEPFRFALFTDLHISTSNPVATQDLLNAINDVNEQQNIDFVLVAGDVSDKGDTTSLKKAKQMLQTLKIPFYVVPGNHDFRWNVGNGCADFICIFGDDKFVFSHENFVFAGIPTVPLNKTGNAYVQKSDMKWLKKTLKKEGKKKTRVIVTHYPLLKGDMVDWKKTRKIFQKLNVTLVLNGHYHRNILFSYDGIPGIVNRSTLPTNDSVGGYSIYSISDSIKVSEKPIGKKESCWLAFPLVTE